MTTPANPIARLRSTTRRSAIAALALAATASLAASPAAQAAGARPHFQMPVACGQTWDATTYDDHGPDPDSIDLAQWDGDGNISAGEAALASADGTVSQVGINGKDENYVFLDHGNGWTTQHKHLESIPPLKVGQLVAQGEQIGRVGNTGIQPVAPHLHYTQLADGKAVRIQFNGAPIKTHAGDESTWGKWPGGGEKLTSSNCPGRAFLPFDQDGKHHVQAYAPGTGATGIASISPDAASITNPWSTTANRRWTHFMPFTLGGEQRYISYKHATGETNYGRIGTGGPTKLSGMTWGKGWTHLMPFTLGGKPYFVAYDSLTGDENVDRINAAGNGSATLASAPWSKGWTQLAPFRLGGVQHFIAYRGGTGEVKINTITGSGDGVTFATVWKGNWGTGLTHVVPVAHNGAVHLIRYKQATGAVSFDKLAGGAQGLVHLGDASWTKTWTTFSRFTLGGTGHVMVYKPSGWAKILRLNAAGSGVTTTYSASWTPGLA
ncbi:MAG: peptidoglycan DD-metalloendopeptidase family protein [Solirubrobacteraceae bacterium]